MTKGRDMIEMHEVPTGIFAAALEIARREREHVADATSTPEEIRGEAYYEGTRFFLAEDLHSGFGVMADGTLVAVFSTVKGRGRLLIEQAIRNGAWRLDCFDGFLPDYYRQFGFVETSREANWTPGAPDVVFMALPVG